jgi:hypothetical protein
MEYRKDTQVSFPAPKLACKELRCRSVNGSSPVLSGHFTLMTGFDDRVLCCGLSRYEWKDHSLPVSQSPGAGFKANTRQCSPSNILNFQELRRRGGGGDRTRTGE